MDAPVQLVLSGIVHSNKVAFPGVGDVALHPGAGHTPYIDATIFDGRKWRALDLKGFGFGSDSRVFGEPTEIGQLMRQIENKIKQCKGSLVYYESPVGSTKRKYIFRGARLQAFLK